MNFLDHIRQTMNPQPVVEEQTKPVEQGINPVIAPKPEYHVHEDDVTRAYKAMLKEDDSAATVSGMGAKIAKQDPVKMGGKTPVELNPQLSPPKVADGKPLANGKNKPSGDNNSVKKEDVNELAHYHITFDKFKTSLENDLSNVDVKHEGDHSHFFYKSKKIASYDHKAGHGIIHEEGLDEDLHGLTRVLGRKLGDAAAHTVAKGLGVNPDTVKDLAMAAVGRQKIVRYRYALKGKTPVIGSGLRQGQHPAKAQTTQHPQTHHPLGTPGHIRANTIMKQNAKPASVQPAAKPAPAPAAKPATATTAPKAASPKPAGQTPSQAKMSGQVKARFGKKPNYKVNLTVNKPRVRVKTSFNNQATMPRPAPKPVQHADDGSVRMDRKEFAKRLKAAGGNLKKVTYESMGYKNPVGNAYKKMSAEEHLEHAALHHNTAMDAKESGDRSMARMHFNARDKHYSAFARKADIEVLKRVDQKALKHILDIREGIEPLKKVIGTIKRLRKSNTSDRIASKMDRWQILQKQIQQQKNEEKE